MIVYHGSGHCFRQLRICRKYMRESSEHNEGAGIYFSIDRNVACGYGKYIYTLNINDDVLVDFRKRGDVKKYLAHVESEVYRATGIRIQYYYDKELMIRYILNGNQRISDLCGRGLYLLLDSSEKWYTDGISETKRQAVYRELRKCDKELKEYMFPYHIKNIGIIKDLSPDVVRIVSRERNNYE